MKNSSEKEKKKSQTRSSIMKTIGNGNNVSYGVNVASFGAVDAINAVLQRARARQLLRRIEYQELPGVENRGPMWFYLAELDVSGKWFFSKVVGETSCGANEYYFMYREDFGGLIFFRTCELIDVLENNQNFDPPFNRSETRDWFLKYGSRLCFFNGKCPKLNTE